VQDLLSVRYTVYVFAMRPEAIVLLPPAGDHVYVKGEVPPLAVTVAEPFAPPMQLTLLETIEPPSTVGCVRL
jgi:hypothetical protein